MTFNLRSVSLSMSNLHPFHQLITWLGIAMISCRYGWPFGLLLGNLLVKFPVFVYVLSPLWRDCKFVEDCLDRTCFYTVCAVYAVIRANIVLVGFVISVYAVYRAYRQTCRVFYADAWLGDHEGHWYLHWLLFVTIFSISCFILSSNIIWYIVFHNTKA